MSKVIIHIGYHKTATTSMQDDIFEKQKGINYLGKSSKWYGCDRGLHQDFVKAVCSDDEETFSNQYQYLKNRIDAFAKNKDFLISDELLLGDSRDFMGGNVALSDRLDRISKLLSAYDIEVLLTLREYKTCLHSLYVQKYPYINGRDFSNFCKDPSVLNLYYYFSIYSMLKKRFREVHLLSFEALNKDEDFFKEELSGILGVDIKSLKVSNKNQKKLSSGKKVSSGFSVRHFIRSIMGENVFRFIRNNKFLSFFVGPIWDKVSSLSFFDKEIPKISDEEIKQLNEIFYSDMLELKALTNGRIDYSESFE